MQRKYVTFKEWLFGFLDETPTTSPEFKQTMESLCNTLGRGKIETLYREWKAQSQNLEKSQGEVGEKLEKTTSQNAPQGTIADQVDPKAQDTIKPQPYGSYWWQD